MRLDVPSVVAGALAAAVGAPLSLFFLRRLGSAVFRVVERRHYPRIGASKKDALRDVLRRAEVWVALDAPPKDLIDSLTKCTVAQLRSKLLSRSVTAVTLLRVFLSKALDAHKKTNCLVWIMLDEAIAAAHRADDAYAAADPEVVELQPLLGIPLSMKENLAFKGTDCTLGLYRNAMQPVAEDSGAITHLKRAGANIFVKTNVPALLMSFECENALFGVCTNPHNSAHTTGGSSGGEAALIALCGSAAGVGTDIGGSIRIPAVFCGIVGVKPTNARVSNRNNRPLRGDDTIPSITGPMGRCVDDVTVLFRALTPNVTGAHGIIDGTSNQIPFNAALYEETMKKKTLRIGIYVQDGFITTSPACARAVEHVKQLLVQQGHEVVPFTVPRVEETISVFYEILGADGTRRLQKMLGSDDSFGVVKNLLMFATLPYLLQRVAYKVLSRFVCPVYASILERATEKPVDEFAAVLLRRNQCRDAFADAMAALSLDAVVGPGFYLPAPKCGATTPVSFAASATSYYNVIDVPVVAMPVTTVRASDTLAALPSGPSMSKRLMELYDASAMQGLPVGVQIITPRFTEEKTLAVAKRIESLLLAFGSA